MPFSFETFAWAVSALFQLLAVCAYLLSFPHVDGVCDQLPDIDGVDDQLPDVPEVIQDIAIDVKIKYSGIMAEAQDAHSGPLPFSGRRGTTPWRFFASCPRTAQPADE